MVFIDSSRLCVVVKLRKSTHKHTQKEHHRIFVYVFGMQKKRAFWINSFVFNWIKIYTSEFNNLSKRHNKHKYGFVYQWYDVARELQTISMEIHSNFERDLRLHRFNGKLISQTEFNSQFVNATFISDTKMSPKVKEWMKHESIHVFFTVHLKFFNVIRMDQCQYACNGSFCKLIQSNLRFRQGYGNPINKWKKNSIGRTFQKWL